MSGVKESLVHHCQDGNRTQERMEDFTSASCSAIMLVRWDEAGGEEPSSMHTAQQNLHFVCSFLGGRLDLSPVDSEWGYLRTLKVSPLWLLCQVTGQWLVLESGPARFFPTLPQNNYQEAEQFLSNNLQYYNRSISEFLCNNCIQLYSMAPTPRQKCIGLKPKTLEVVL